ncbi:MAG: ATP-binding cassette domain-containing protein [Chromatiales bacterium]
MSARLVDIRDLVVEYPGGSPRAPRVRAVAGVSLGIDEGVTLGIVGESGSGKSTLARALLGLVDIQSGQVEYGGMPMAAAGRAGWRRFRREVQVVFQDPAASLDPRMSVARILAEPLLVHRPELGAGQIREITLARLGNVGLDESHLRRLPRQLSGGECQRVAIARALVLEPRLLICDEPVSALDISIQAQILALLRELQQRLGLTVMFIAHDLSVVRYLCKRVAVMYRGSLVETANADALFRDPQHPYTRALLGSVPVADPRQRRNFAATAATFSAAAAASGCIYADRCPRARERCRTESPSLERSGDGDVACFFPGAGGDLADGERQR